MSAPSIQEIARCLGGQVVGNSVHAPGPNHKPGDRSMTVTLKPDAPDGFLVHTFSPRDTDLDCKNYVRERLGLESWKPNGGERPRLRVVPPPQRIEGGPINEDRPLADAIDKHTPDKYRLAGTWRYRDESGTTTVAVARYDPIDSGNKTFRPFISLDGKIVSKFPSPRPLYGLDQLAARPDDPVLIVEGEKTADAAGDLIPGYVVVTSSGGAAQAGQADWSPLAERNVTIWPDNDDAGHGYARGVQRLVPQAKIVTIPKGLPEGWDLGDQAPDWLDIAALLIGAECAVEHSGQAVPAEYALVSRRASEVGLEPVSWIWKGRIARGKHTCIAGEPGTGKSQLSMSIAATITMGGAWPCGEGKSPQGSVIILSAEDGAADTIVPRLHAAEADCGRVQIIQSVMDRDGRRSFNLQRDLALLEAECNRLGDVLLIIIDPISSYLGKTDSHKNAEVRGVLEPIGEFAERMKVAVLSITHFSKGNVGSATKALHRFIGSIAFVGAPRIALAVLEEEGRRLLLHAKNNLAPPPQGLAYKIEGAVVGGERAITSSRVVWEVGHVDMSADDAMQQDRGRQAPDREDAEKFLREMLANGPVKQSEIKDTAVNEHAYAWATVRRAYDKLGVKSKKDGADGPWIWSLPPSTSYSK